MKKLLALSALAFAASPALALEQPYIGLDYVQTTYDVSGGTPYDVAPGMARLRMGTDFSKYVGAEAHLNLGTSDDEAKIPGPPATTVSVKVDSLYSIGLTARLPLGSGRIYAFGGYSYVQASLSSPALASKEKNDDGVSYGIGAAMPIGGGWLVEADYTAYIDKQAYSLTGMGVGVRKPL